MTTQNNSNELRVERDADITEDIRKFTTEEGSLYFAGTYASIDDKMKETYTFGIDETTDETTDGTTDGAVSGVKFEFGDGNITSIKILLPIQHAMSISVAGLDDNKKEAIKKRAEASKEENSRGGIGE